MARRRSLRWWACSVGTCHTWIMGLAAVGGSSAMLAWQLTGSRGRPSEVMGSAGSSDRTALAVVSMWLPESEEREARVGALYRVLAAIASLPVAAKLLLVTNVIIEEAGPLVEEQIVRSDPQCSPTMKGSLCMTWEAIYVLRSAGLAGERGCIAEGAANTARVCRTAFDYYLYIEGDIEIPLETFQFWVRHVDYLFESGYVLSPYRVENNSKNQLILTDCFMVGCASKTMPMLDFNPERQGLYTNATDRIYLQPLNPYTAGFIMNRAQFLAYVSGPMWSYSTAMKYSPWGMGETAASGLIWDPRYGKESVLTHMRMPVLHLFPITGSKGRRMETLSLWWTRVDSCANNISECTVLREKK